MKNPQLSLIVLALWVCSVTGIYAAQPGPAGETPQASFRLTRIEVDDAHISLTIRLKMPVGVSEADYPLPSGADAETQKTIARLVNSLLGLRNPDFRVSYLTEKNQKVLRFRRTKETETDLEADFEHPAFFLDHRFLYYVITRTAENAESSDRWRIDLRLNNRTMFTGSERAATDLIVRSKGKELLQLDGIVLGPGITELNLVKPELIKQDPSPVFSYRISESDFSDRIGQRCESKDATLTFVPEALWSQIPESHQQLLPAEVIFRSENELNLHLDEPLMLNLSSEFDSFRRQKGISFSKQVLSVSARYTDEQAVPVHSISTDSLHLFQYRINQARMYYAEAVQKESYPVIFTTADRENKLLSRDQMTPTAIAHDGLDVKTLQLNIAPGAEIDLGDNKTAFGELADAIQAVVVLLKSDEYQSDKQRLDVFQGLAAGSHTLLSDKHVLSNIKSYQEQALSLFNAGQSERRRHKEQLIRELTAFRDELVDAYNKAVFTD